MTADDAIRAAAESTQPEVALAISGYMVVTAEALARHEYNFGELVQLRKVAAGLIRAAESRDVTLDEVVRVVEGLHQKDTDECYGNCHTWTVAAVLDAVKDLRL